MIPKIIHYCWFGRGPLPELAQKCIASWKKYLPDYEIKEWNEDNFDVNIIPYTAEAYKAKKYAFVSDYARFWILYKFGGIYFDTDVEVIRPIDDIVERGNFMGFETDPSLTNDDASKASVAPGLGKLVVSATHPTFQSDIVAKSTSIVLKCGCKDTIFFLFHQIFLQLFSVFLQKSSFFPCFPSFNP